MTDFEDEYAVDAAVSEFELLITFSEFDGWPVEHLEMDLRALLETGPSSVAWLAAPSGKGLGYRLEGPDSDDALVGELVDQVERMLGPNAAEVLGVLVDGPGERSVVLEQVHGIPAWYRVGLSFESFDELETMLAAMQAPPGAVDRALRYRNVDGARPRGFSLVVTGERQWSYQVATRLERPVEEVPDGEAVGAGPVTVEETIRDWTCTWLRRPGLTDEALIEWQNARRYGVEAAGTVGEYQATLGVAGPDEIAWIPDDLPDSVVYVFEDRADLR